jgi:Zn-dependent protease with chaperone function
MKRVPLVLFIVLTIPLLAWGVAARVRHNLETIWVTALREYPKVRREQVRGSELLDEDAPTTEKQFLSEEQIEAAKLCTICRDPVTAAKLPACKTYNRLVLVTHGAWVAGVMGLVIVLAPVAMGWLARGSRAMLLWTFAPLLFSTVFTLFVLIILHVVLLLAALYYFQVWMMERVFIYGIILMFGIAVAGGLGAILMIWRTLAALRRQQSTVLGKSSSRQECPSLWYVVDQLAQHVGTEAPEHLVVGLDPSFFVTTVDVRTPDEALRGRSLYVSLPLCRIMNQAEVQAVIVHELAHFRGDDAEFSRRFAPIYHGAMHAIVTLDEIINTEGNQGIVLLPSKIVLMFFVDCFTVAERRIGRARELAADRCAGDLIGGEHLASALLKLQLFQKYWEGVVRELQKVEIRHVVTNASELFHQRVRQAATTATLTEIPEKPLRHPTDTHPLISERLVSLGVTVEQVRTNVLDVTPTEPAITLIDGNEVVERALTERLQSYLASHQLVHSG